MQRIIIVIHVLLMGIAISCTSEDAKIKKTLKASVSKSLKGEYKYDSHLLLETILKSNLTDSISSFKIDINTTREMMLFDSLRLSNIRNNMKDCRRQRANTMYFFKSAYDDLIEDYEKLEEKIVEELEEKNSKIAEKEAKIAFWSKSMHETDSPIVFYKVKHTYKIRGMYRDTVVLLNSKYEIVK